MMHVEQVDQAPPSPPLSFWQKLWVYMHFAIAATLFALGVCYIPFIFSMFVLVGGVGTAIIAGFIGYGFGSCIFADPLPQAVSAVFGLVATTVGLFLLPATPVAVITLTISGLLTTLVGGFGLEALSNYVASSLGFGSEGYEPVPDGSESSLEVTSIRDPDHTSLIHTILSTSAHQEQQPGQMGWNEEDEEDEEDDEHSDEISSDSELPNSIYGKGLFSQPTRSSQPTKQRSVVSPINASYTSTATVELFDEITLPKPTR